MYENLVYRYTVPQRIIPFFNGGSPPWGQWLFYGFGVWPWLPPCIPGSETGCCWSASRSEPLPYSAGVLQHHHALLGGLLVRFNSLSNNWIRSIPKPGFFPEYVGKYGQVANFPLTIHQFWACASRHPMESKETVLTMTGAGGPFWLKKSNCDSMFFQSHADNYNLLITGKGP